MKTSRFLIILLAAIFAAACAEKSKSNDLMAVPPEKKVGTTASGNIQFEFNPKVDILFVIDNSFSMSSEQARLQQAAARFVESFGENNTLDYRIGVITPYDNTRCGKVVEESLETGPNKGKKISEEVKCYPMGQLQPVKSTQPLSTPFITRFEGAKEVLRDTMNVGTLHRLRADSGSEYNGPQFEEFFAPILRSLDPSQNRINGGFIREDARLVIVIVTDEGEMVQTMNEEAFIEQLDLLKREPVKKDDKTQRTRKNYELNAVVFTKTTDTCKQESYAEAPTKIIKAVRATKGKVLSICDSSFGDHLGDIGSDIRKRLLKKSIPVPALVESGTLDLKYGGVSIPRGQGWSYDPDKRTIAIDESLKVIYDPKASFSVDYTLIDPRGLNNGNAQPMSKPARRP